ncbi:MAG: ROK family protein [Acidobacteriota bacterium]|nr:ROK family protein [Acidobacteriota bacterium]MDQ7087519.1 ROK family protein [Acidobacteriota bacterium]
MRLVGDIGATHTRLGTARAATAEAASGVEAVEVFASAEAPSLEPLLVRYTRDRVEDFTEAVLGVPGPVRRGAVQTTNLPWRVEQDRLAERLGCPVTLLNDVEVAAWGVAAAEARGLCDTLQAGRPEAGAARVLLTLGTGLGQAVIARTPEGWWPLASEGSHVDFGPADDRDAALWREARNEWGHVSWERFVSGPGLVRLVRFLAAEQRVPTPAGLDGPSPVAAIVQRARDGDCELSRRAVGWLSRLLGAQAGNLALAACALGGVYLAGGLLKRLGRALDTTALVEAFRAKGRYRDLLAEVPLRLVPDDLLGLRGAALVPRSRLDHSVSSSSKG